MEPRTKVFVVFVDGELYTIWNTREQAEDLIHNLAEFLDYSGHENVLTMQEHTVF